MNALPAAEPAAAPATRTPWHAPLRSTLLFLAVPALALSPTLAFDARMPPFLLYVVAAAIGLALVWRSASDPEWLLAVVTLYLPFKKLYVAPIAPGINGTNALLMLLVFACIAQAARGSKASSRVALAGTRVVAAYAFWSGLSMLTAVFAVGGGEFLSTYAVDIKGWIDQFLIFFLFAYLVRDGDMARRMVVYMMLGIALALASGTSEWLDKRHVESIERSRVLGPQVQPNDYGAFLVYGSSFFIAILLRHAGRVSTWVTAAPALALIFKMLLATFSRGAYLAVALGGVVAAWLRGRILMVSGAVALALLVSLVPEIVPESLSARMSQTGDVESEASLDTSSRTRLVLWHAAIDMTFENPVLGKGFKMFPVYKGRYTEYDVPEGDNHNMFLYLSSQMGLPALLLFLLIMWRLFRAGLEVYRRSPEPFAATIGMAAAAMVPAVLMTNMFGSRMVDIGVSVDVWVTLAVIARLHAELPAKGPAWSVASPAVATPVALERRAP